MTFKDVLCTVNVQHDCAASRCNEVQMIQECQEHLITTRTKDIVNHKPTNAYLLNIHALHNYQYIASVLPPSLRSEGNVPLVNDHQTVRLQAAKLVRSKKSAEGPRDTGNDASVP